MCTILDLEQVRERVVRWSVEDYERFAEQGVFPERTELIRGIVINKVPKSPLHCALSKTLYDRFQKALPSGFVVFQGVPLRLADSEPEPDVAVVRGGEADFEKRHPSTAALVVEVAVSSPDLDRANAPLYAEAGVEEYWIVLGLERQVEVYRWPANGVYSSQVVIGFGETLACESVPGVTVSLGELFA
jgi:Uma2 family endonuclease